MSDGARSMGQKPSKGQRILMVSNPSPTSSDEEVGTRNPIHGRLPPTAHLNSSHSLPIGRSSHSTSHVPTPLTTNLQEHKHFYPSSHSNPSNPALSSPSSTSSPALESTPPPSTPGQSNPPVDFNAEGPLKLDPPPASHPEKADGTSQGTYRQDQFISPHSERNECSLHPSTSRPAKLFDKFKSHLPSSRRLSGNRPATSPTTSIPDSYSSHGSYGPRASPEEKKVIWLVTADADQWSNVNIAGARDASFIRERIFTKLRISDEDQPRFSIYRSAVGEFAIGDALNDDQLYALYRERDHGGNVHLLVSESHARVHEQSHEPHPASPTVNTIPPPVLPQHSMYPPLRIRRQSSRSGRDSETSASERFQPEVSAGYEASVSDDLEHADWESRRSTMRPVPHQYAPQLQPPPRPRSPAGFVRSQSPGGMLSPERQRIYSSDLYSGRGDRAGHTLPTPPPPPGSPQGTGFRDEAYLWGMHVRSASDAAGDRDGTLSPPGAEGQLDSNDRQRRLVHERDGKEREARERSHRKDLRRGGLGPRRPTNPSHHQEPADADQKRRNEGWTVVPSGLPSSGYSKHRPTTPQDARSPPHSRYQASNGYHMAIPHPPRAPPPTPPGPNENRSHGKQRGKAVPHNWVVGWKGPALPGKVEQSPLQSPPAPSISRMIAKSMNDLRGAYNKQQPPVPQSLQPGQPARPPRPAATNPPGCRVVTAGTSSTGLGSSIPGENGYSYHDSSSDMGTPKSYDASRSGTLSPTYNTSRSVLSPAFSTGPSVTSAYLGLTSPGEEPYPRPHSALSNDPASSPYRTVRHLPSPRGTEFPIDASTHRTSPVPSPLFQSNSLSPQSGLSREDVIQTSFSTSTSYGPRPNPHPFNRIDRSPDVYAEQSAQMSRPPRTPPRSPVHSNMVSAESKESERRTYEAPQVQRTLSSLPVHEDDSSENTVKRHDYVRYVGAIEKASGTVVPAKPWPPTPPQRLPTPTNAYEPSSSSNPNGAPSTMIDFPALNDDDSDSDGGGTIWAKKPQKVDDASLASWQSSSTAKRPVLAPISTDSSPSSAPTMLPTNYRNTPRAVPPNFPAPPNFVPTPPPLRPSKHGQNSSGSGNKKLQDQRISRFDNNFDFTWAPRPPPEEVFERLQDYFPEHDVDEPVIEAPSGGTSPTSAEHPNPLPTPENKRFRHKKSIRVVAAEHKRRVTSHVEPTALQKRNTKLWGSRLEEVTTAEAREEKESPNSELSPGGAKPIFRWVRGELIGKGTYGKVYLALNATTGEMIAVKQVEMPRTASDKDDSRQVSMVEALKLESETLKDLDHPHIVQYLGFEETPTFLSIFLEYVPGGSIASCLRKHGKFDEEVTKSFTGQILSGLEYLHSKGILHRDLKADNILVETSGICKISDFGISKRTEDINFAGNYTSMQGTVFWMAPEVINSKKSGYNSKIDIWSVGCVVFEMWTGQRPWNGQEAMAVLLQLYQTRQGPPVPKDVNLSSLANDFRQQCFAMDPDERPTAAVLRNHPYLVLQPDWVFTGFK